MENLEKELQEQSTEGNWEKVEEIWIALSDQEPGQINLYVRVLEKLIGQEQTNRVEDMTQLMVEAWLERDLNSEVYQLLEPLVRNDILPGNLKETFLEAIREHFSSHPALDLCFEESNLHEGNISGESLDKFLELLTYRPDTYVYHSSGWGSGRIREIEPATNTLIIDFENRPGHTMKLDAASRYLIALSPEDPRALYFQGEEVLEEALNEEPEKTVAAYLKTRGTPVSLKELRNLLKERVFSGNQWNRWWNKVRPRLMKHPNIKITGRTAPDLTYREQSKEPIDELIDKISYTEDPEDVRRSLQNFSSFMKKGSEHHDRLQEKILEKFEYFMEKAREGKHRVSFIELILYIHRKTDFLSRSQLQEYIAPVLSPGRNFQDRVGEVAEVLNRLQSQRDISEVFDVLEQVVGEEESPYYESELLLHVRGSIWKHMAKRLIDREETEAVSDALYRLTGVPGKHPLPYLSMVRARNEDSLEEIQKFFPSVVDLFRNLIELSETYSERYLPSNYTGRKFAREIEGVLKRNNWNLVKEAAPLLSEKHTREIRTKIKRHRVFKDSTRAEILSTLEEVEKPEEKASGYFWEGELIYSTEEGIRQKEKEYNKIISEKMPENQEAIRKAREMGDVSENAELDAALEERSLLTSRARNIKKELDRARSLGDATLEEDLVQPGTRITVTDQEKGEKITYTILGPWDSDADQNVISYKTPLADALLGKEPGEVVEVSLPDEDKTFRIETVERVVGQYQNGE